MRLVHSYRLNMEFESVFDLSKVNEILEFFRPDTLSASRAFSCIINVRSAATLAQVLNVKDTNRAERLKFFSILIENLLLKLYIWY